MLAEKRRYQTLYFVFFAAGSGITAFRNVYFEELGLSGFEMGVIGAVMVGAGMFAQPLWGVVADRFGASPAAIADVNARKNFHGSAKAGSLGFNAHVANAVASAFLATGQDEAQVVEGSNAITTASVRDGDLYVSVSIASLPVGTVGGGTSLPAQSEALSLLGVAGGGDPAGSNADELAEVVAAAALAGELNLLGALAADHLASAHADLGR